jgi:hypothetical protein
MATMSINRIIHLLFLAVLLAGCNFQQPVLVSSVTSNPTIGEVKKASATPKPVVEINPTSTSLPLSHPLYPTTTITKPSQVLIQQCMQLDSNLPKDIVPPDILAIHMIGHGISLFDFKTGTHRDITGAIFSAGTSPDGKWLVYDIFKNNNKQLVFESMLGEKTIQIPEENSWSLMNVNGIRWMDNQRIWFPEISNIQPATSVLVLNPFTGQKELLKTDYPGTMHYQYGSNLLGFHFDYSSAAYDPSLNYVVYPEFEEENGYFQILRDRNSRKVVARISSNSDYHNLPIWKENQKQFLMVGYPDPAIEKKEWLGVGLDGQIHQLTDFEKLGQKYSIDNNAVLSPDEKLLAFSLSFLKADGYSVETRHLILLNLETQEATDTCLSADRFAWSVDGQYLAASTPLIFSTSTQNKLLLVDLKANRGYQLLEGSRVFPAGWLSQK